MRLLPPRSSARLFVWFGVATMATLVAVASQLGGQWTLGGHDASNTRNQDNETRIDASNVSGLTAKWTLATDGDVSATPAVKDGMVYVPDWAGQLYAVNASTGNIDWQVPVEAITGVPASGELGGFPSVGGVVRTTPAVAGNVLIMGDQGGRIGLGAKVFAVDRKTGAKLWVTQIQGNLGGPLGDQFAIVTQSPVVDENNPKVVYVGTASWEEAVAAFPIDNVGTPYPCCSFRGTVTALNISTGEILWQTYMTPAGYSGNGVWGSTGAIDVKRKTLYVTTGNNYSVPQSVLDCVAAAGDDPGAIQACMDPNNHFDSIVALNTDTGAVRWATRALPYDAWNVDCVGLFGPSIGNCPDTEGPDYDFGQGPALFTAKLGGKTRDLVGAGQKSGMYWTLDRDTGQVIWSTHVGPGGTMGGLQWGSAVDENRIYVAVNNSGLVDWTPLGASATTNRGAWSALDKATGQILWQTETPDGPAPIPPPLQLGSAIGAVTVANGVAYACTFAGSHVAMDASTGSILWTNNPMPGELCGAGAAASRGTVYWGTGYGQISFQSVSNGALTAYGLP
ncbi:MAG: PQQ-binding-like beta-propeller repeat protein [Vicinamibacterales bacterium]